MKRLIFLALLLVLGGFAVQGQTYISQSFDADTLANQDTADFVVTQSVFVAGTYSFAVRADSLSGDTEATGYIEVSNTTSGDLWREIANFTVDGVSTVSVTSGVAYGVRYRLRVISPSSTQSTRIKPEFAFKRDR